MQGERYSLSQQVLNFETTLKQLRTMMNETNLSQYLAKSIAILVFGSNDYINNYLMPFMYTSSSNYTPPEFANLLLNSYARQLLVMYKYIFTISLTPCLVLRILVCILGYWHERIISFNSYLFIMHYVLVNLV